MAKTDKQVIHNAGDVSAFERSAYEKYYLDKSCPSLEQAKEWAFYDLLEAKGATETVEKTRIRKLVESAFAIGGEKGAELIGRIPDTSGTQALEVTFGHGEGLFHLAVTHGDPYINRALLKRVGQDISPGFLNHQDKDGATALHALAGHSMHAGLGNRVSLEDRQKMAQDYIEAGISTSLKNGQGLSVSGYLKMAEDMAEKKLANPNLRDIGENEAYLNAIYQDAQAMRTSIRQGKLMEAHEQNKNRDDDLAVRQGSAEIISLADRER